MSNYNFSPTSRYYNTATKTIAGPDGDSFTYLARRFVPPSDSLALLRMHAVVAGERLDIIAASELGDPLVFWLVADANDALRPEDLVARIGTQLRITLPAGIPAPSAS